MVEYKNIDECKILNVKKSRLECSSVE